MHLALQRFQQARPILDFHFALQQDERRDFARRDAAAPPPAVRAYTAVAVWPTATWLSARAAAMLLVGAPQRHHGRIATLRPRLIKQKTAYLVCDEMSSKIGRPGM